MLDFPASPALNQTYSFGGRTWRWNGTGWQLVSGEFPEIPAGGITAGMLAPDAVTAEALAPASVTPEALAPGLLSRMVRATAIPATGKDIDITGIPDWALRVTLLFSGISMSNTQAVRVQLGTASQIEASGYASVGDVFSTTLTPAGATNGFQITNTSNATDLYSGTMTISNITGNTWVAQCVGVRATSSFILSAGSKTLNGVLTRLRLAGDFDAGTLNLIYEG